MASRKIDRQNGAGSTDRPTGELLKLIGAMSGLTLVSSFSLATRAQALRRIKQEGLYKAFSATWEEFCEHHLPISRRTADEDLRFLERLGDEFVAAAEQLGLGRRQLRSLSAAPEELLPRTDGDEIVVGEERVPLSDQGRVVELLEELIAGQERLQLRIEQGEDQLARKSGEVRDLREELQRIEDARAGRLMSQADHDFVCVLRTLRRAADWLSHPDAEERPLPGTVLAYYRAMAPALSEIVHYGGQYVTPDWARDPEALYEHMQAVLKRGADAVDAEGGIQDDSLWGDEDELL